MDERQNQLFSEVEKVKYKALVIHTLLMPISVPPSRTPQKWLQFLNIVIGSFVEERIDGKQTPDSLYGEIKYFGIKDNIYEAKE